MCWERLDSLLEVSGKLLTTLKYSHSIPVQSKSLKGFQKGLQKPTQSIDQESIPQKFNKLLLERPCICLLSMICKANANSESLKCDDTNERIHFEEGKQVCEALS